jgi:hypothetical protein
LGDAKTERKQEDWGSFQEWCLGGPVSKFLLGQTPVVHACNPSYSGGRDQEDRGLKPTQAGYFVLKTVSQENSSQK